MNKTRERSWMKGLVCKVIFVPGIKGRYLADNPALVFF